MADKKISQLTAGTEVVPVVQSGSTVKTAVADLTAGRNVGMASATLSSGTANGVVYLDANKQTTSGSALAFNGTNLGIGTASPTALLSVQDATAPKINLIVGSTERAFLSYTQATFTTRLDSDGPVELAANNAVGATIDNSRNVTVGVASLATTATNGFLYVPTCAGTPTGTPTAKSGFAPIVVDTTNNKLYFYSGGSWRDAGP